MSGGYAMPGGWRVSGGRARAMDARDFFCLDLGESGTKAVLEKLGTPREMGEV